MKTTMGNWVRTALLLAAVLGVKSAPGDTRIVGGESVEIRRYPYQLSLQLDGSHYCGAAIISEDWALTSAYCSVTTKVSRTTIRAGSSNWETGGTIHKVTSMTPHPNYVTSPSIQYDIALIKVKTPFVFGTGVKAIELAVASPSSTGYIMGIVSGWGLMNATETTPPTNLQAVQVIMVLMTKCQELWNPHPITDTMICAGGNASGGIGICTGDSGGPLVFKRKYLIGIVSFGKKCAKPNYPDVYARIANPIMRKWINETTGL